MNKLLVAFCLILLVGIGCRPTQAPSVPAAAPPASPPLATVDFPIDGYQERRTFKAFGEFVSDRFQGYHAGDDVEYADTATEVPVRAIADGVVKYHGRVSGYGGVMIIEHDVAGEKVLATYGHLDIQSSSLKVNDAVVRGQTLAILGAGETAETDGERKHLHFALRPAGKVVLAGYAATPTLLAEWINATDFFARHGLPIDSPARTFSADTDLGGDAFRISFTIPKGWEVEYVPSIKALNLFPLAGAGTARERSQIFLRFFDSTRFETLTTVIVHTATDTTVGRHSYTAKRYDIEKKAGVADFPDQPAWRNSRHTVTDFRDTEGRTRYYVVAADPLLAPEAYATFLDNITITE